MAPSPCVMFSRYLRRIMLTIQLHGISWHICPLVKPREQHSQHRVVIEDSLLGLPQAYLLHDQVLAERSARG